MSSQGGRGYAIFFNLGVHSFDVIHGSDFGIGFSTIASLFTSVNITCNNLPFLNTSCMELFQFVYLALVFLFVWFYFMLIVFFKFKFKSGRWEVCEWRTKTDNYIKKASIFFFPNKPINWINNKWITCLIDVVDINNKLNL